MSVLQKDINIEAKLYFPYKKILYGWGGKYANNSQIPLFFMQWNGLDQVNPTLKFTIIQEKEFKSSVSLFYPSFKSQYQLPFKLLNMADDIIVGNHNRTLSEQSIRLSYVENRRNIGEWVLTTIIFSYWWKRQY